MTQNSSNLTSNFLQSVVASVYSFFPFMETETKTSAVPSTTTPQELNNNNDHGRKTAYEFKLDTYPWNKIQEDDDHVLLPSLCPYKDALLLHSK